MNEADAQHLIKQIPAAQREWYEKRIEELERDRDELVEFLSTSGEMPFFDYEMRKKELIAKHTGEQ